MASCRHDDLLVVTNDDYAVILILIVLSLPKKEGFLFSTIGTHTQTFIQ